MMNDIESWLRTAEDLMSFAIGQNIDLGPLCSNGTFGHEKRHIFLWSKDDGIHYNLQGRITVLPEEFSESSEEFRGRYQEVGILDTIEKAFNLVKAWLICNSEVSDLPERTISKQEID